MKWTIIKQPQPFHSSKGLRLTLTNPVNNYAQLACSVESARPEVAAGSQVPSSSLPSSGTVTPAASALAAAGRFGAEDEW